MVVSGVLWASGGRHLLVEGEVVDVGGLAGGDLGPMPHLTGYDELWDLTYTLNTITFPLDEAWDLRHIVNTWTSHLEECL